ncbi:hypothetical protein [Alkalibacterium kapii]|uniref:Uncharacterized protein n=1 Tax=Alkalibacterium kapii TaxID=426704 RepID=A0A511ASC0_9LACT|nr:hypothetical protein [Alkalibacterium kapii]GEK91099.1 hypothetical protein AKA01nite_07210 [Alkalibacterium kapii]
MTYLLQNKKPIILVSLLFMFLTGWSFAGIRTPLYDGEPVEPNEAAIDRYASTQQIDADNEENYFRYPLSDTLFEPSLEFSDREAVTLKVGTYRVGEDLPEGRVIFEGQPSDFSPQVFTIRAGNVTVYDTDGDVTFENHFQERAGVMQAVADLREGQTVKVDGETSEIHAHYNKEDLLNDFDIKATSGPESSEFLRAGHHEVGKHIKAGLYTLEEFSAPRTSVIYHFTEGKIEVVELTHNRGGRPSPPELNGVMFKIEGEGTPESEDDQSNEVKKAVISLKEGDKLYLPMVDWLELKVNKGEPHV